MLSMSSAVESRQDRDLQGLRIALVGKLGGMSKRDAQLLMRRHGAMPLEEPDASADLLVLGEQDARFIGLDLPETLDDATRQAIDRGTLQVITETQLWQRLGLVEGEQNIRRLYTPGMLAELLQVPVAIIRRWHRRGLIIPTREVRRLPYFNFAEVAAARRLAELLASGMSPQAIERKLADLARYLPGVDRPLAQLSVIVEGKNLLLRQGEGLIAPGGQYWFNFDAAEADDTPLDAASRQDESLPISRGIVPFLRGGHAAGPPPSLEELMLTAAELDDADELPAARDVYRAALAAHGPQPQVNFALAELLYRLGDLPAARERYYMAIELDEDYVEARANLGCVLAELGERELAVAAFQGALVHHQEYPDVHYHLARILDETPDREVAEDHWRAFLELSPHSPWADEARARLGVLAV
jgi:DNA-binding transcriptional MerR regulator